MLYLIFMCLDRLYIVFNTSHHALMVTIIVPVLLSICRNVMIRADVTPTLILSPLGKHKVSFPHLFNHLLGLVFISYVNTLQRNGVAKVWLN